MLNWVLHTSAVYPVLHSRWYDEVGATHVGCVISLYCTAGVIQSHNVADWLECGGGGFPAGLQQAQDIKLTPPPPNGQQSDRHPSPHPV
jgi:hypothetical protein